MRGTAATTGRDALPGEELLYVALPDEATTGAVVEGLLDLSNFEDSTSVSGTEDGAAKDVVFHGSMTFRAPGDYVFGIGLSPELNRLGGMFYDEHVGVVIVHVTAGEDGRLAYEVERGTGESAPDFENTYAPTSGEGGQGGNQGGQAGQAGGTATGADKPAAGANAGKQIAKTGDGTDLAGAAAAAAVGAGVVLAGGGILLKRRTSR